MGKKQRGQRHNQQSSDNSVLNDESGSAPTAPPIPPSPEPVQKYSSKPEKDQGISSNLQESVAEDNERASKEATNNVKASREKTEDDAEASKEGLEDLDGDKPTPENGNEEQEEVETSEEEVWEDTDVWGGTEISEEEAQDWDSETEQSIRDEQLEGQLVEEQLAWTSKDVQTSSRLEPSPAQEEIRPEIDEHTSQESDNHVETSGHSGNESDDSLKYKDEHKAQNRDTKRSIPMYSRKPLTDDEKIQLASEEVSNLTGLAQTAAQEKEKSWKTYQEAKSRKEKAEETLKKAERKLIGISNNRKPPTHHKTPKITREETSKLARLVQTTAQDKKKAWEYYQNATARSERAKEALRSAKNKLVGITNKRKHMVSREKKVESTDDGNRPSSSKSQYKRDEYGRIIGRMRRRQPPREQSDRNQKMVNGWYERTREMQKALGDLTALIGDLNHDEGFTNARGHADDELPRDKPDYHQDRIDGWYKQTREFQEKLGIATDPNDDMDSTTHQRSSPYILKRDGGYAKSRSRRG